MGRPRKKLDARTAAASDIDAVVALLLADDPTCDDNAELRRLLKANANLKAPLAEVGGYARISSYRADRDGDGSIGVLRQAKKILRVATERNVRITRWYLDNDVSAAKATVKRPSYLALLEDLRAARVGGLLVLDITRLYRQSKEFVELVEVYDSFPRGKRPWISTTDGQLDLSTEIGRFVAELLVLVGKLESANISKRVRDKKEAQFADGRWAGGMVPYGYRYAGTPGELELEPEEATTVRAAARIVLDSGNVSKAVRHLNSTGRKPRLGDYWRHASVRKILTNLHYAGWCTYQPTLPLSSEPDGEQRQVRTDAWPAILTDVEMARLKAILTADGRRSNGATGGTVRRHLGSGLLTCGPCGKREVRGKQRSTGRGQKPVLGYTCMACRGVARPADMVDAFLHGFLLDAAESEPDLLAEALTPEETNDAGRAETLARLAVVQEELAKDPADVIADCGLTFATYSSLRRGLVAEEKALLADLVPAGRPGRVLPPAADLEALMADPANLTAVHDLLTTYLDAYGLEIVLNRVGRGQHNYRAHFTIEERPDLYGIEVRRAAEASAAA